MILIVNLCKIDIVLTTLCLTSSVTTPTFLVTLSNFRQHGIINSSVFGFCLFPMTYLHSVHQKIQFFFITFMLNV